QVIEAVLDFEEPARIGVVPRVTGLVVQDGVVDAVQVAARAKRLFASAVENHERYGRVVRPRHELVVQDLAHGQGETVQRTRAVQCRPPHLQTPRADDLEQHNISIILHHLMSTPLSMIWRAMMTRMISLVPSRIWCTRVSRTSRSGG